MSRSYLDTDDLECIRGLLGALNTAARGEIRGTMSLVDSNGESAGVIDYEFGAGYVYRPVED